MNSRFIASLLTLVLLATSCATVVFDDGQVSFVDEDAQLKCSQPGAIMLAAQAVPTATHIPCIDAMPSGWRIEGTEVRSDRVLVRFDSGRAPIDDLTLTFTSSCIPASTVIDATDSPLGLAPGATISTEPTTGNPIQGIRLAVTGPGYCADFDVELGADEPIDVEDFPTWLWIERSEIDSWVFEGTNQELRLDP